VAFHKTFDKYGIGEFDIATLDKPRMRYDSHERGLLRSALVAALIRNVTLMSFINAIRIWWRRFIRGMRPGRGWAG